jgi:glyoxylase-like metal-dependent hydrolase (beta-lactamase superfamily II)
MHQLKLVTVIDTHNHAEHATAAPELRQLLGVPYLMHEKAPSSFVSERVHDNQVRKIAGFQVKFLHTPGHTPHLVTVQIDNHIFTGDSLFLKSCGRADFPGVSDPGLQFDTLHRLKLLPDDTVIHPGHDYNNELSITLGESKRVNKRLQFTDREEFIRFMDEFYRDNEKPDDWEWYVNYNAR